jgi:hypothetical protein
LVDESQHGSLGLISKSQEDNVALPIGDGPSPTIRHAEVPHAGNSETDSASQQTRPVNIAPENRHASSFSTVHFK